MTRVFILAAMILAAAFSYAQDTDILFRGGDIIDGTGSPAIRADIAVKDGRIVAIGDLEVTAASRVVDADGLTIVPGFIDMHSHADEATGGGLRSNDEKKRAAPNLVAQGITTVVVNQDGRSPDIGRQRRLLEQRASGPNAILMVGHNSIRRKVLGSDYKRAATQKEIDEMRALVREGMESGARGMSAGLEYVPGIWSEPEEVVSLVNEIVPYNGTIVVHERASGADPMWYVPSHDDPDPPNMIDNMEEMIALAEKTGANVVATHVKARGENVWGASQQVVDMVNEARDRGVNIYADQYPYTTSGSDGQIVLIPSWVWDEDRESDEGTDSDTGENENDRDYATMLRNAMGDSLIEDALRRDCAHEIMRRGGSENIIVMDYPDDSYIGKSLFDLAKQREMSAVDLALTLQLEGRADRAGGGRLRGYSMSEKDVETYMKQPWTATGSDAGISLPDGESNIHARFYGTYPRKIREYAINRGVISVEHAIRASTSLPASIMNLDDRGVLREGYAADITVIDLETIQDKATFFNPHQYPEGVEFVMINGEFVVDEGELTYALPGKVLASTPLPE